MDQNKFENTIFDMLKSFQNMSKCTGSHVAACLIDGNRIVSIGWNGTPAGLDNCDDIFSKVSNGWEVPASAEFISWIDEYSGVDKNSVQKRRNKISVTDNIKNYLHGKWSEKYEIHAEMNMLFNAMKQQVNVDDLSKCTVFITHSPCSQCMKNLAGLGIKNIKYKELYWRDTEENLARSAKNFGIIVKQA